MCVVMEGGRRKNAGAPHLWIHPHSSRSSVVMPFQKLGRSNITIRCNLRAYGLSMTESIARMSAPKTVSRILLPQLEIPKDSLTPCMKESIANQYTTWRTYCQLSDVSSSLCSNVHLTNSPVMNPASFVFEGVEERFLQLSL